MTASNKSTVLSILKENNEKHMGVKHRVRFSLPKNVKQIILDAKSGAGLNKYLDFVRKIRDSDMEDRELITLLEEAKGCISLLDYDMRLFVQSIAILGWAHRSDGVVQSYQEFINCLVTAHSQYVKVVIDQIVKQFRACSSENWVDGVPGEKEELEMNNLHTILKSILRLIPLTEDLLLNSVKSHFPYYKMKWFIQLSYVYNTIKIMEYLPHRRRDILLMLTDKLLILDVNAPREEVVQADFIFILEEEIDTVAMSLDQAMLAVFRYINSACKPNGELKWVETKSLFSDLIVVLDKSLLNTIGNHHVQFLLLYICSFKSTLSQSLLNTLWEKVMNPTVPTIARKMSVAYLASYLARAKYLSNGYLKTYLSEMVVWLHRYVTDQEKRGGDAKTCFHAHVVFYSVCQALFYVIAFRHKDLVDSRKKMVFLQSLNLSKIVSCPLNPLRACSPGVVENFAAVARDYQLAYCYTIMENNSRGFLQSETVDDFFPFDPYVLRKSSTFITPLYNEYAPATESPDLDEELSGRTRAKSSAVDGEEEEDDFIAESKKHDKLCDISYGTSPGFTKMSV